MNWDVIVLVGYGLVIGFCCGGALGLTVGLMALQAFKRTIAAAMAQNGLTEDDADL